jgi:hypothetical protein
LVHKLFERTLQQAQGPSDHFLRVDEMSYVVSFQRLSLEEASLACAVIAKSVCELLFGSDVEDISFRSLVGLIPAGLFETGSAAGVRISDLLDQSGGEIIVRHPPDPSVALEVENSPLARTGAWTPGEWIARAHDLAAREGHNFGFFPSWDLLKRQSFSLYASLGSGTGIKSPVPARRALNGMGEVRIVEMETAVLFAAAEYALRLQAAGRICALGIGVSYETMSGFNTRIRYIGMLKKLPALRECPLLIRIEQVPEGTPLGRIAEIVAMINLPNVRVSLEFKDLRTLPEMDIRLGAAGIGGILPKDCDVKTAVLIAQRLVRRAKEQKCFAFLHNLSSPALLRAAQHSGVGLGSGAAIGPSQPFTGREPLPNFPMLPDCEKWLV